ncbi:MAG: hypothetical protein RL065_2131 [Bacteroidota bacterium]
MKYFFNIFFLFIFSNCFSQKHFDSYNIFEERAFKSVNYSQSLVKKFYSYYSTDSTKKIIREVDSFDLNGFLCKGYMYKFGTDSINIKFEIYRNKDSVQYIKVEIAPSAKEYQGFQEVNDEYGNWIKKRFIRFKKNESLKFLMKFNFKDTCHYYTDYFYWDGKLADRIYDYDTVYCGKTYPIDYITKRYLSSYDNDSIFEFIFPKRGYKEVFRYTKDSLLVEHDFINSDTAKNGMASIKNSKYYFYNSKKRLTDIIEFEASRKYNNGISGRTVYTYFNDTLLQSITVYNHRNELDSLKSNHSSTFFSSRKIYNKNGNLIYSCYNNEIGDMCDSTETKLYFYNPKNLLSEYHFSIERKREPLCRWINYKYRQFYEYDYYDDKKNEVNK